MYECISYKICLICCYKLCILIWQISFFSHTFFFPSVVTLYFIFLISFWGLVLPFLVVNLTVLVAVEENTVTMLYNLRSNHGSNEETYHDQDDGMTTLGGVARQGAPRH